MKFLKIWFYSFIGFGAFLAFVVAFTWITIQFMMLIGPRGAIIMVVLLFSLLIAIAFYAES